MPAKKKTGTKSSSRTKPKAPKARKTGLRTAAAELRDYAMTFPGATEDFPWGERVAKVNGKVFVFLGCEPKTEMGLSVKLPVSCEEALELPFTKPTAYGLGKAGWVSATFGPNDAPPVADPEELDRGELSSRRAQASCSQS